MKDPGTGTGLSPCAIDSDCCVPARTDSPGFAPCGPKGYMNEVGLAGIVPPEAKNIDFKECHVHSCEFKLCHVQSLGT